MLQTIKKIFSIGPSVDLGDLINKGAIVVDVRTKEEFSGGHVKGSVNIPLNNLSGNLKKFKNKEQTIITCCASGMRSASAKNILKSEGYTHVYNGGSWHNLKKYGK